MTKRNNDCASQERNVLLVKNPGPTSTRLGDVLDAAESARNAIYGTARKFEALSGFTIERIAPKIIWFDTNHKNYEALAAKIGNTQVRIIFDELAGRGLKAVDGLALPKQSHVVISIDTIESSAYSWTSGMTPTRAVVNCDWKFAPHLTHDVLMDIAVFRAVLAIRNRYNPEIPADLLASIDNAKYDLVNSLTLKAPYTTGFTGPGYVSLCAFARDSSSNANQVELTKSEIKKLVQMWETILTVPINPSPLSLLDYFKDRFKRDLRGPLRGAFNIKKIAASMEGRAPGDYQFWYSAKRPRTQHDEDRLPRLFNRTKFRIGMWRILSPIKQPKLCAAFEREHRFLKCVRLTRPEPPDAG